MAGKAIVCALTGLLTTLAAAEPGADASFLPTTRAAFATAMKSEAPGTQIPLLRCGEPLALRHCRGTTRSGMQINAADTYETVADIEAFQAGAEGKLYHWQITSPSREPGPFAELFVGCTVALKVARGLELGEAGEILTETFEAAAARPSLDAVNRDHPAILVVDISGDPSCLVTAQWHE